VKLCYFETTAFSQVSGSEKALVRCGGKLQQLLIAYFLSNMCAKHYENPTMLTANKMLSYRRETALQGEL